MQRTRGWLGVVGIVCLGGVALALQHQTQAQLLQEIGELRRQNAEIVRQREENQRLRAGLPGEAELERLRADHAAIPRLQAEISAMRARAQSTLEEANLAERFEAGGKVPCGEWKNAGTATSKATLETALWAAAGGDVEQFAQCLMLPEGRVRQRAVALLDGLPPAIRAQHGTPERLVAFFAIKDVPLGVAQVIGWDVSQAAPTSAQVQVQLSGLEGQAKEVLLRFSQQGADWKLVVPEGAIARYSAMVKGLSTARGEAR